jgi:hypothetical protein
MKRLVPVFVGLLWAVQVANAAQGGDAAPNGA